MDHLIPTSQENERTTDHVVKIMEADEDLLITSMETKINQRPKLLTEWVGKECCCIFRLPKTIVSTNEKTYEPCIVSMGPYHHGKEQLEMIQEQKWRFLGSFLSRTKQLHGVGLNHLFQLVASQEERIRESYSELIDMNGHDLVEMMILDGCFMIELFYKVHMVEELHPSGDHAEPMLSMNWILPFIARDFLKLENQIPFFLLETLFEQTKLKNFPSLKILTLSFFHSILGRPYEVSKEFEHLSPKHILDLFRLSLIPKDVQKTTSSNTTSSSFNVSQILSAEKLHRVGVQFQPREAESFLDIEFHQGVLQIPTLILDDFSISFLQNCVAFEQCYRHCSNHITTFATFMGFLINNPRDVGILRDKNIIDNYIGADEEIACFFNNLGKDMLTDINDSYLTRLFVELNKHSNSKVCLERQRCRESMQAHRCKNRNTKSTYVWVAVVFLLLILTMVQLLLVISPSVHVAFVKSSISLSKQLN